MHNNVAFTFILLWTKQRAKAKAKFRFFLVLQSSVDFCWLSSSFAFCFVLTSLSDFPLLFAFCIVSEDIVQRTRKRLKGRLSRPTTWFKICTSDGEDEDPLQMKTNCTGDFEMLFFFRTFQLCRVFDVMKNGGGMLCVWQTVLAN